MPCAAAREVRRAGRSGLLELETGADLCGLAQHDGCGAIAFMRQRNGAFHRGRRHAAPADDEVHVDAGEHLGVLGGTFGGHLHLTAAHVVAPAFQDQHDVVRGTAARASEHGFHGPGGQVAAAALGWSRPRSPCRCPVSSGWCIPFESAPFRRTARRGAEQVESAHHTRVQLGYCTATFR